MSTSNNSYTDLINAIEKNDMEYIKKEIENFNINVKEETSHNTLLHYAVEFAGIDVVKFFIEYDKEILLNEKNKSGLTPLLVAIYDAKFDIAQYLIDNEATFTLEEKNKALLLASPRLKINSPIEKDNKDIVKFLIKNGADVNAINHENETALMMFKFNPFSPFGFGITKSSKEKSEKLFNATKDIMTILLNNGTDINACDKNGKTALMKYVNVDYRLTEFLIGKGSDIHIEDKDGKTVLFYALNNFNTALIGNSNNMLIYVQLLVNKGVELNIKNNKGETPLMIASEKHSNEIVNFLIKNGANINEKDKNEETALLKIFKHTGFGTRKDGSTSKDIIDTLETLLKAKADISIKDNKDNTAFILAVKNNLADAIWLLIDYGVDISKENIAKNALFLKSLFHDDGFELADYLLDNGVDLDYTDEDENTFLHLAIYENKKNVKAIDYLICKDNGKSLNNQNKFGYSPFMIFIKDIDYRGNHIKFYKSYEEYILQTLIPYMIEKGANINSVSKKDELLTPLTLAIINKREHTYNLLMDKKADTSRALRYLMANDLYFEKEYFNKLLEDFLPNNIDDLDYSTRLSLLESWSYFDKRIDVDKIDKCIFLLEKLKLKIKPQNDLRTRYTYSPFTENNIDNVRIKLKNNLFSNKIITFEDVLRKFIEFPKHNPQKLVKILTNFTIDTPIKYTTHEWRKRIDDKYFDNFDLFLDDVSKQFKTMGSELKELSPNLYKKIEYFICEKENVNSWKHMKDLKEWVEKDKEPFDFP